MVFVPIGAHGNDFLHVFIFCAETVGGCPAVAEAKQAVCTNAEPTQDATHVIGRLGIGQRDVAEGGTPVSAGIHSNHAKPFLQARQQRGKVVYRSQTTVQQHEYGRLHLSAGLVMQACALVFKRLG